MRPDPLTMIDSAEYDAMARDILAGHGLTDRIGFVRPPLYPLFVAACYAVGGIVALQLAQIVLGAATAVLVALLAQRLYDAGRANWTAGLVAAAYPWFLPFVGGLASETLFTFLATGAFLLVLVAAERGRLGWIVASGSALGVAALARSNLLVFAPFVALWWLIRPRGLLPAAVFAAGVGVALLPFAAYNLAAGNGLVLASSGGGINFYIGNNPDTARYYSPEISAAEWRLLGAKSILDREALAFAGCDPDASLGTCYDRIPYAEREAFWYRAGFRYIASAPGEWALTEVRKLIVHWRPWVDPRGADAFTVVASGASFGLVLLLAIAGLTRMSWTSALFVLAVAAGSTLAAVAWAAHPRYRFAVLDPVLIAAAGPALEALLRWSAFARGRARSRAPE